MSRQRPPKRAIQTRAVTNRRLSFRWPRCALDQACSVRHTCVTRLPCRLVAALQWGSLRPWVHELCIVPNELRTMKASQRERSKQPLGVATHLEGPGFVISDVTRLMRKGFDRKVRDLGLTRPQWRVLVYVLDNEGLSQSELARRLELVRAPLGQLVRALESLRLVMRRRSTEDAREWIVEGGESANSVLPELIAAATWLNEITFQGITRADRQTLLRLLERMRSNLSFELER